MNLKNLFKFALSSLLLSGSLSAFAEGEATSGPVTLGNGTTMTWAQFVNDLKTPPTSATGVVPEDAQVRKDLAEKQQVAQTAQATLDTKTEALEPLQKTLEEKESTLDGKKTALGEAVTQYKSDSTALDNKVQEYITAANAALKLANDSVTSKESQISIINGEITALEGDKTKLENAKEQAQKDLTSYENTLLTLQSSPTLQKKTETKSVTAPWLKTIITDASNFNNQYMAVLDDKFSSTGAVQIYYKASEQKSLKGNTLTLTLSYINPNETGWAGPVNASQFVDYLMGVIDDENPTYTKTYTKCNLKVYLGSNYADATESTETTISIGSTDIVEDNVCEAAYRAVNNLASDQRFQVTTTTQTNEYLDDAAAQKTLQQIEDVETKIANLEKQLYGTEKDAQGNYLPAVNQEGTFDYRIAALDQQITAKRGRINTIQGEIKTINEVDIPGYEAETTEEGVKEKYAEQLKTLTDDVETAQTKVETAQGEVETAQSDVDTAQQAVDEANEAIETAKTDLAKANQDVADAQQALADAQAAADATALEDLKAAYQTVTLTDDVTADNAVGINYAGKITGNGHVINIKSGVTLFDEFTGRINKAAINGTLATDATGGKFIDVAVWTGSGSTPGRYYNDDAQRTNYTSIDALGYEARDFFGVDFAASKLAALAPTTIVYDITTYANGGTTGIEVGSEEHIFVTMNDTKLYSTEDKNGFTLDQNVFAVSTNAILFAEGENEVKVVNLIYPSGKNYYCDNVELTDKVNFYSPLNFTAKNLYYNRAFKQGYNTVCLPFPVNANSYGKIEYVCKYDKETPEKFWFTAIEGNIEANTPVLLVTTDEFTGLELTDYTFAKTNKQVFQDPNGSDSWGTYKQAKRDEFGGASNGDKVYGLNGDKFQAASANALFTPFRMVLSSTSASSSNAPMRSIGIRDEQGKEIHIGGIVTGIEDVDGDMVSLDIRGGHGEIIITSETELGQVEVYALDGRLAAIANVVEGTTSVNVANGLYIVMGKKVVVK